MTERERLIEILLKLPTYTFVYYDDKANDTVYDINKFADYLLENGVIVPPCKVGDTVYYFSENPIALSIQANTIYKADVVRIGITNLGTALVIQIPNDFGCTEIPGIKVFGKEVFLTREEAEKALREGK